MRAAHGYRCVSSKPAFTLVELLVVNAAIVVILGMLQPAVGKARGSARDVQSQSNMTLLGRGGSLYANDKDGAIFTYQAATSFEAIRQQFDILKRLTARSDLVMNNSRMPYRRYSHLPLMDYLGAPLPSPFLSSPFDRDLTLWQQDPAVAEAMKILPYTGGSLIAGSDKDSGWFDPGVIDLWPYGSSYQVVPASYLPDNGPTSHAPRQDTPNFFNVPSSMELPTRRKSEVRFPSGKVHLFEEYDRLSTANALWYAYPNARCNQLFFDGSVRQLATSAANPGWSPWEPTNTDWRYRYRPLDTFPWFAEGYRTRDTFNPRYRWTRQGLAGLDYRNADVNPGAGFGQYEGEE